ncbi:MAG: hypothetical protein WC817_03355 [Patescibacteria group bacterium]|jgi:hypothetical protein
MTMLFEEFAIRQLAEADDEFMVSSLLHEASPQPSPQGVIFWLLFSDKQKSSN